MSQAQPIAGSQPVILIIDDERDLVDILSDTLSMSITDHEVVTATNFDDALRLLSQLKSAQRELSLLVVDQEIGDHSGLDVMDHSRVSFPDCACLLYTGRAHHDMAARAASNGAKVLWKPQRLHVLVNEIRELI